MLLHEEKKELYRTKVVEIGREAKEFKQIKMVILFGENAPEILKPSCYIIEVSTLNEKIEAGMILLIDNNEYEITGVGEEVQNNLKNLGHIAINFTGDKDVRLPGSMNVENKEYPEINVGTTIKVVKW